ncbi:MAG TPA: hypothetical protein VIJ59_06540, partial [Caulobacteraceae bacterium]
RQIVHGIAPPAGGGGCVARPTLRLISLSTTPLSTLAAKWLPVNAAAELSKAAVVLKDCAFSAAVAQDVGLRIPVRSTRANDRGASVH